MLEEIRRKEKEFKVNKPYVEGRPSLFDFEVGTKYMIDASLSLEEELALLDKDAAKFNQLRQKYLLY